MDLLTQLSVRFTDESRNDDYEEDPNDSGGIGYNPVNNPHHNLPGIICCPCCSSLVLQQMRVKR